jgi:DNA-binding NtrC family response regulator
MKTILILENDPRILTILFRVLMNLKLDYMPIVLSTSEQVNKLINPSNMVFDLILLDRNCSLGRSFHILDIAKFGPDKVIGMSSVSKYNDNLLERGVSRIVTKNYDDLDQFEIDISRAISEHFSIQE